MAILRPDKTYMLGGIVISEKLIPDGSRLKPNRPLKAGRPEYITIHNTPDINEAAGTNDAEQYARATLNGNMNGVSVHFYIDEDFLAGEGRIGVHPNDNTATVWLQAKDLVALIEAHGNPVHVISV